MLKQTPVNVLLTSHYLVPRSLVDEEATRDLGTRLDITVETLPQNLASYAVVFGGVELPSSPL